MMRSDSGFSSATSAAERLHDFLELQANKGLTQNQVATRAGIPPQYLSDIKHQRRPMTELIARRIADEFSYNFEWLLGTSDALVCATTDLAPGKASNSCWVPCFNCPIEGEPRANSKWDGAGIEVAGLAAAKLLHANLPYVLKFGHADHKGRLRKGDLLLISQIRKDQAEYSIIEV